MALIGLRAVLTSVRDQILSSPYVPTLEEVFARLLCITSALPKVNSYDASIMVVQSKLPIFKVDTEKENGKMEEQ